MTLQSNVFVSFQKIGFKPGVLSSHVNSLSFTGPSQKFENNHGGSISAIYAWLWNENAWTIQKQQMNGNRVNWLVYRTDTNAGGFWLVKGTLGWKDFIPKNLLEIKQYFALMSYCNMIGQSNNAFSILGFSLVRKWRRHFWPFHPLAVKTNNEHLLKLFFKVIRKSLLPSQTPITFF